MVEEKEPWSYQQRVAERMQRAGSVLDQGTGGGERLLALRSFWPPRIAATEDYPPNLRLASGRLAPFGVEVKQAELHLTSKLPYTDGEFDLVINRHSGFNFSETARILSPGGTFLTQQIHGMWAFDLMAVFGAKPKWPFSTPGFACQGCTDAGVEVVDTQTWSGQFSFTDVGAIVYYLKAVPWLVDQFSVDSHLDGLIALQEKVEGGEVLSFWAGKYMIEAVKPR